MSSALAARAPQPTLTLIDVAEYLLRRGLVSPAAVVDGDLLIRDLSARNHNFSVERRGGASYLIKQGKDRLTSTVAHEGVVYRVLSAVPSMQAHLPGFHGYDADCQVLVLNLIHNAVDLRRHHSGLRRPAARIAANVGSILSALHALRRSHWVHDISDRQLPVALLLHRPDMMMFRTATAATLRLFQIIQGTPGFSDHLDELNRSWSATTLIHQDVRLSNFLLAPPVCAGGRPTLKLVDWELACVGDPRWDIGSALGEYLSLWLRSIPVTGEATPDDPTSLARRPLLGIQRAVRACWDRWTTGIGGPAGTVDHCPIDVTRFAAARLVQTAFEIAQRSDRLSSDSVLHLQVAMNLFERPHEGALHLLGLPLAGPAVAARAGGAP